jgi:hypothetical protein
MICFVCSSHCRASTVLTLNANSYVICGRAVHLQHQHWAVVRLRPSKGVAMDLDQSFDVTDQVLLS